MNSNLKATRVLLIDATLVLVISVTLVLLNVLLLNRVNNELTLIDEVRINKLKRVNQLKRVIRERSILMVDMLSEKDAWDFQDKQRVFHGLAIKFIHERKKLNDIGLLDSEIEALQSALVTIRKTEPIQNAIVERIRDVIMESKSMEGIYDEISKIDFPLEFLLLGQMETLYERISENANLQRISANKNYRRITVLVSIISFAFIVTIILLMARSLRKIRNIEIGLLEKAESLSWDATHDPLTNIFNRRWLEHKIEFLISNEQEVPAEHSLLYLDLDGFKQINDDHGHHAGDHYLIQFCREVEHEIRQNDTFCRMGGDEFAILLENCGREVSVKIANELLSRVTKFVMEFEGNQLTTSCSIGVCQFKNDELEFEYLIKRADEFCYQAKNKGKNQVEVGAYV